MRTGSDAAASELVSTMLLVLVAVSLAGVVAVAVGGTLSRPHAPSVAFSLVPIAAGDARLNLTYADGSPMALSGLRLSIVRANGTSSDVVAPSSWTTPDARMLLPGDAWGAPLAPAAGSGERIRVLVVDAASNAIIADLIQQASGASASFATPTLSASITPASLPADGTSSVLLTVRASHPAGALAIGRVEANLSALYAAGASASRSLVLVDDGTGGDAQAADGIWSALLVAPTSSLAGTYPVGATIIDAEGASAATTSVNLTVVSTVANEVAIGTRFVVPTSANVTSMHLRNWTWDMLNPSRVAGDVVALRIVGGNTSSWSAVVGLAYTSTTPCVASVDVWTSASETIYTAPGGCVALAGLDLDLLNFTGWSVTGSANPTALYPAAAVNGTAVASIPFLGEDNPKNSASSVANQGIFSLDVVIR